MSEQELKKIKKKPWNIPYKEAELVAFVEGRNLSSIKFPKQDNYLFLIIGWRVDRKKGRVKVTVNTEENA